MKKSSDPNEFAPTSVHVLRTLGHGRAARAQLVEATFRDGSRVKCVEKVFAPGWLTRLIYRIGFQSPFAYQTNFDAISASFYRRRVAAAAIELTDLDADVATPLYVRYDKDASAWVLAAKWIDGRGVKPAPVDDRRLRRACNRVGQTFRRLGQWITGNSITATSSSADRDLSVPTATGRSRIDPPSEIDELVSLMRGLEDALAHCGLIGSGWQVSPAAFVSTANLLRNRDDRSRDGSKQYTVIDLESGIPAVLVPRYIAAGARRGILPMFEDIDAGQLRRWLAESNRLVAFRIGPDASGQLRHDVDRLIEHTQRWKASEIALTRRPWRLFTTRGIRHYQNETFRRWRQQEIVDDQTAAQLDSRPFFAALVWWLGWVPTSTGKRLQRIVGNVNARWRAKQFVCDRDVRRRRWRSYSSQRLSQWQTSERIPMVDDKQSSTLSVPAFVMHRVLQSMTLPRWHRWIVDADRRRRRRRQTMLALLSPRYQSWLGKQHIEASIVKWQQRERLTEAEAESFRQGLAGEHVPIYARGFGMHLGLKAIAPLLGPAKLGGIAAYLAGASVWFLFIPFLLTPAMRTLVTAASMWSTRKDRVPHAEAMIMGMLPTVGTLAFPIQMFTARRSLSTFLIRDAASRLGRHLPIYGGPDSRTEMAMIRGSDFLVEAMTMATGWLTRLRRAAVVVPKGTTGKAGSEVSGQAAPEISAPEILTSPFVGTRPVTAASPRTRIGRWLDEMAIREIRDADAERSDGTTSSEEPGFQRAAA